MVAVRDEAIAVYFGNDGSVEEEQQAMQDADEAYECECLSRAIRKVINGIESLKDNHENVPEYGEAWKLMYEALYMIMGRAQELDGEFCLDSWKFPYSGYTTREREAMSYARQEGINYVALSLLRGDKRIDAVDYIREHGLSSFSYAKTLEAVKEYSRAEFKVRTGMDWAAGEKELLIP